MLCDRLPSSQCHLERNSWSTTSCTVKQSSSMLGKVLAIDPNFSPIIVCNHMVLYENKLLEKTTVI